MPTRYRDITGQKAGRLTALRFLRIDPKSGGAVWEFKCECGNLTQRLTSEWSKSIKRKTALCGRLCPFFKPGMTHGQHRSPEYRAWRRMLQRCYLPKNPSYARYGGRGITVHPSWKKDFMAFLRDLGPIPSPGMSLDRIDNDQDYKPGNCRWATAKEQANNRGDNVRIETPWGKMTLSQAAEKAGICPTVLRLRTKHWKPENWFKPVREKNRKMQTKWGLVTIKEACKKAGIDYKVVWSRMSRGITDPEELFDPRDRRK